METGNINIYGKLVAQTGEGKVADTDQIFDKTLGKFQSEINGERDNYYTKEEIDNLVEAIKQFNIQIVNTLPEASESTMFTIYLIPSSNPKTTNSKDEYITVKNGNNYSWEQVGSTEIDLSGYSTTEEMNAAILSGLNNLSFLTGEKVVNLGIDEEPTAGSENLVKSGGVLSQAAMFLSNIFPQPVLINNMIINKNDGRENKGAFTTSITDYIEIQEGKDIFVYGIVTRYATSVALYSEKSQDSFIQAEQNNSFVHYTSEALNSVGAKYLRCTISGPQVEKGDWFVITSCMKDIIDKAIAILKYSVMSDVKKEDLLSGGSLDKNNGGRYGGDSINYRTDYLKIKEGHDISVKAWGSKEKVKRGVVCLYSDATLSSFITSFYNDDEFTIKYTELAAIGAKYFRCSISAEQVENGDWYIRYLSGGDFDTNIKNAVTFTEQSLDDEQKGQARDNIDAAYKYFAYKINLNQLTIAHNTISNQNKWVHYEIYDTVFVKIKPQKIYKIHADLQTVVAVLTADGTSATGDVTTFATGFEGRIVVPKNSNYSFTCPDDGRFLYILTKGNAGYLNPSVEEKDDINAVLTELKKEDGIIDIDGDTLYNSIPSKRRIADSIGNSLTPLSIPVDEDGYEIPTTREVLNVQKKAKQMTDIVWTPLADIPYHGTGGVFPANTPVKGLPYSSVKEIDKYIGFDVSIHTFMTALNNPYSLLYTECVRSTRSASAWGKTYHGVDSVACYMGTVCSALSGYGSGQVVQWSTAEDRWCAERNLNMVRVFNQSAQGLHIGDIIWISGHNRLVVGLKRDSDGNVTHVQITESAGSHVYQNNDITAAAFDNKLATERGGGIIYRNTELYKNTYTPSEFVAVGDETITPYVYNDDICTFAGNKACFRENDLIVINYNLKNSDTAWTAIEVYKDDALFETYNIADIDQSELPEGQRNHALKLGSEHTYGMYKARLTDGTNYSDYTYWEVLQTNVSFTKNDDNIFHIEWGSENSNPLSFTICNINGTVYAHNELSIEDIRKGYLDIDLVAFNKQQYPDKPFTSGMYLKIHFEGQYGRVTNEPLLIVV